MTASTPIAGMWVVSSEHELTPEIVEHAKDVLEGAAVDGKQVVVVEGITFRWRPVELDAGLDVDRLAEAARAAGRKMNVPLLANPVTWRDFADEIVAEYIRLSESAPPVAPLGETP